MIRLTGVKGGLCVGGSACFGGGSSGFGSEDSGLKDGFEPSGLGDFASGSGNGIALNYTVNKSVTNRCELQHVYLKTSTITGNDNGVCE